MTRLAACYFCGIALDEPLEEYPVVPTAFRDGRADPPTATLCPTCAEKLTEVLGRVTEAADATDAGRAGTGPTTDATDADDVVLDPGATTNGASSDAGGEDLVAGDAAAGDDVPDDATAAATSRPSQTPDGATKAPPSAGEDARTVESTTDTETRDHPDDDAGVGQADAAGRRGASGSETEPAGRPETGADPEGADPEGTDPEGADPEGTDPEGADAEGTGGAGEGGDESGRSVVEGEHSISALEYNKVMRLLQNREFPIDRAEIVTVAANAYGLARSDCDHVIDVAIDRGLIEDADGELRRPDND